MKKRSKAVVFFGNERLATGVSTDTPVIKSLLKSGYSIKAIVSHYERGRSRNTRGLEIARVADENGIPLLLPERLSDIQGQLVGYEAVIGVLAAYGKLVPQSIIDIFPEGIINVHPSLLPLHRGPTPIESVILDGSASTGVSIMGLVKEMDAGPIYAQQTMPLTGKETKQSLADTLSQAGAVMIIDVLEQIYNGKVRSVKQNDSRATFDSLITKESGVLDFNKPAFRLEREVRAYLGWPQSRTTMAGREIIVTKAHVVSGYGEIGSIWVEGKQAGFYTSKDILAIDTLKPAGRSEMTTEGFLAGYGPLL